MNVTKICTDCYDGYWITPLSDCQVKCDQGLFTNPIEDDYETKYFKPYKALMGNG